jgi:5-methylcytosine-specific restriction endonuclease McrA
VQREVWQRDGGQCVECSTREHLCFDHIVPFSKGGGNSVRNIQLLCEGCNLSKSNRI